MTATLRRPHAVLLARVGVANALAEHFRLPTLAGWSVAVAQGLDHAHFQAQLRACDVLLVDEDALGDDPAALAWLVAPRHVPVLLLTDDDAATLPAALALGVHLWLPRSLALSRPEVFAEALRHARRAATSLRSEDDDCRAHVERLTELLWNALPVDGQTGWLTQHYALERLHEEVVRSGRHGTPLTVVLGEVAIERPDGVPRSVERAVRTWAADLVLRSKRLSDVAGQYGTRGFLLLLPHTSESGASVYCRRLRRDLEQPPPGLSGLHASFGLAAYSDECRTPKGLLRLAEERLAGDREAAD
jgi:PleD family two-component response regulator